MGIHNQERWSPSERVKMSVPATETIWWQLSDDLRRFIRRRVADDHVAEDLLQDSFLRVHRGLGQLQDEERLAAWVYQIAVNVIHDHYRRQRRDVPLEPAAAADDPAARTDAGLPAVDWLGDMIRDLPASYREAVELAELQGLTQREVGERLGLSHSGAKSRVQRGRALLREALDRCCTFHFDRRGNLLDCDRKPTNTAADCCGCDTPREPNSPE